MHETVSGDVLAVPTWYVVLREDRREGAWEGGAGTH